MGIGQKNAIAIDDEARALTPLVIFLRSAGVAIAKEGTKEWIIKQGICWPSCNSAIGVDPDHRWPDSIDGGNYKAAVACYIRCDIGRGIGGRDIGCDIRRDRGGRSRGFHCGRAEQSRLIEQG